MPPANEVEVNKQNDKLISLYNKYGLEINLKGSINDVIKLKDGDNDPVKISQNLQKLYKDKDFVETSKLIKSKEWQRENVWPFAVQKSIELLETADKYLFEIRGFKKQSSTDVYLFDKWPVPAKKNEEMGSSKNTYTRRPYLHINLEFQGINHKESEFKNNKWWYDDLLITITHELFHISQVRYLSDLSIDWKAYTWFWEATAITLQDEASKYYIYKTKIEDRDYSKDLNNHLGMCRFPFAYFTGYTDAKDLQNQGYAYSYFIKYLRDQYAAKKNIRPDQYMNLILERFANKKDAIKTLSDQISNKKSDFLNEYEKFCRVKADLLVSVPDRGLQIPNTEYKINKNKPFIEVIAKSSPISTISKKFTVLEKLTSKNDVSFVVRSDTYTIGSAYGLSLSRKVGNENKFKDISQNKGFSSNIYDLLIPSSEASYTKDYPQLYLQEIHSYDDTSKPDSKYTVFAMFKPQKPEIEKIHIGESMNKLQITNKKGTLFNEDFVDKFIISIICPSGELIRLQTKEEQIIVPLTYNQFSIDITQLKDEIKVLSIEKIVLENDENNMFYISVSEGTNTDSSVIGPESDKVKVVVEPQIILTADTKESYVNEKINYTVNIQNNDFQYIWTMGDGFELEGSYNEEYTFDNPGLYETTVTVKGKDGKLIGEDTWEVEVIEKAESTLAPEDSNNVELQYGIKSDGSDPFRKYDEGFVSYDYSQLAYIEYDDYLSVEYYNWVKNEPEGMKIDFYDLEHTKPRLIEYRMKYSDKLYKYFFAYGSTEYDEDGFVRNKTRFTFDGTYIWEKSYDYYTNGDVEREEIERQDADHNNSQTVIKYYDYTKNGNKHY